MKKLLIIFQFLFVCAIVNAQDKIEVTFKYVTTNTKEGYDHLSKLIVYCDDKKIGESTEKKQSEKNQFTVKVPTGYHKVRAVLNRYDNGIWEERTKANNYSLDFVYEKNGNWNTNKTINLTFDINLEKVFIIGDDVVETPKNVAPKSTSNNTSNYTIAANQPLNFKKGDRVVIEVNSMDDHYRLGKKSEYDGATGTVINLEYDDFDLNYKGTIRMDIDNEEVEFNDISPKLIISTNKTSTIKNTETITNTTKPDNLTTTLKKINDFLKTFDNGYYGYLEIKDGYLYDRFKSGKYTKTLMSDLSEAEEETYKKKVRILCKNNAKCVFSTYTDSYHDQLSFSQSDDFNTTSLITLFNNLIAEYKKSPSNSISELEDELGIQLLNPDKLKQSTSQNNSPGNYQTALQKLNDYLKTFDNGYYGYFEVKDGYIYDRFKAGKYNKFKMEDIEGAVIQSEYSRVIFKCKTGDCISTDWKVNGKEPYTQFTKGGAYNYQELADLLNNFRDAYLGSKKQNSSTNNSIDFDNLKSNINIGDVIETAQSKNTTSSTKYKNYETALKQLNDYMITLDNGRYKGFKVEGDYLVNYYQNNNSSKAKISDLGYVEDNKQYNYVKLACTGDKECVYSSITKGYHEYFNFNISAGKSSEKMVTLLNNFLVALKGKSSNTTYNSNTTSSSTKTDAQKQREQKDKERQLSSYVSDNKEELVFFDDNSKSYDDIYEGESVLITGFGKNELTSYSKYINKNGVAESDLTLNNDNTYKGKISINGEVINFRSVKLKLTEFDEDWDALTSEAVKVNNAMKSIDEDAKKNGIKSGTKVKFLGAYEKQDNYASTKKYIGQTAEAVGDITPDGPEWFMGKLKFADNTTHSFMSMKVEKINNSTSTTSSTKYQTALKALNDYLPIYNKETYRDIEVKGSDVLFKFYFSGKIYASTISITNLKQNTFIEDFNYNTIKLKCKGSRTDFWSDYQDEYKDHFQFFTYSNGDLKKLKKLLQDFIDAL